MVTCRRRNVMFLISLLFILKRADLDNQKKSILSFLND